MTLTFFNDRVFIFFTLGKYPSFDGFFSVWNMQKSQGIKSDEYSGWKNERYISKYRTAKSKRWILLAQTRAFPQRVHKFKIIYLAKNHDVPRHFNRWKPSRLTEFYVFFAVLAIELPLKWVGFDIDVITSISSPLLLSNSRVLRTSFKVICFEHTTYTVCLICFEVKYFEAPP